MHLPLRFAQPHAPPDSELGQWFSAHVQPHEAMLRAWLSGRFGGQLDVDDIMQEAYVRVLRARTDGELQAPKAFLFATARNLALDQLAAIISRTRDL